MKNNLQFPSTMSTISYKIYVKRKRLKIFWGKFNNKCRKKLKLYIKQISKFIKFICIKGYDKIVKLCRLNKKIYKKVILQVCKSILNKICCNLKEFCIYCKEQIVVLKIKISNKIHHVKQINEINEKVHIEPTKDALINVNTDVIRFKTKLLAKILLILKNVSDTKLSKRKKCTRS